LLRVAKDKLLWAGHSSSISPAGIWRLITVVVPLNVITYVAAPGVGMVLVPLQVQTGLPRQDRSSHQRDGTNIRRPCLRTASPIAFS
jgi:hypothetical protein